MPTEVYVAVLAASGCLVVLTVLGVCSAIYLKGKLDTLHQSVAQSQREVSDLVAETRHALREFRAVTARLAKPMEDVEHMTSVARGWTDRADRLVSAVGVIVEPAVFFVSSKIRPIEGFLKGFLQSLLSPKR